MKKTIYNNPSMNHCKCVQDVMEVIKPFVEWSVFRNFKNSECSLDTGYVIYRDKRDKSTWMVSLQSIVQLLPLSDDFFLLNEEDWYQKYEGCLKEPSDNDDSFVTEGGRFMVLLNDDKSSFECFPTHPDSL